MIHIFALISLAMAATTAPFTVEYCMKYKPRKTNPVCDYSTFVTYPSAWQAECLQMARGYPKQWTDGPCIKYSKSGNCNASSSINCKP